MLPVSTKHTLSAGRWLMHLAVITLSAAELIYSRNDYWVWPEYSIIITSHNQEGVVGQVIAQAVENARNTFELIVVQDGSRDKTEAAILQAVNTTGWPMVAVRVHRTPNVLETRANNVAMQNAIGVYFVLIQVLQGFSVRSLILHRTTCS